MLESHKALQLAPAQPRAVSAFLTTTRKWSGSAKCGLFSFLMELLTDFHTRRAHMTPQTSINQKAAFALYFFSPPECWSQSQLDHEVAQKSAKAMKS